MTDQTSLEGIIPDLNRICHAMEAGKKVSGLSLRRFAGNYDLRLLCGKGWSIYLSTTQSARRYIDLYDVIGVTNLMGDRERFEEDFILAVMSV